MADELLLTLEEMVKVYRTKATATLIDAEGHSDWQYELSFCEAQLAKVQPEIAELKQLCIEFNEELARVNGQLELAQYDAKEAKPIIEKQERERIKTAKVICLCGSTRFTGEMLVKQWELTKRGYIVVSWCALPADYFKGDDKTHIGDQEGVKELVDEVHKRKIDLSDEVFVLNINGYIGESTASEIAYAEEIGKPVKYWQPLKEGK